MASPSSPPLRPVPSQVTLKTAFTVCFAVVIVAAGVLFVLKTLLPITLTISAAMIAVALDHLVQMFERRKIHRPWAIALVMLGVLLVLTAFFLLLIPPAVAQARALVEQGPSILESIRNGPIFARIESRFHVEEQLREMGKNAAGLAKGAVAPVLVAIGGALSLLAAVVTVLFLVAFMLVFGGELIQAAMKEIISETRWRYERVLAKIYKSVGGYLGGLLLICSINATLTTTFLAIARVPFFLPLGILSGSSSLIPYVGPIISGLTVTLIALVTGGTVKAIAAAVYFVLYGQLEGNILAPLIFKKTVHVNPLVTLLSILFLAEIGGVIGAVIAVPAVAAAQIIVRELLSIRREQLAPENPPPADAPVP